MAGRGCGCGCRQGKERKEREGKGREEKGRDVSSCTYWAEEVEWREVKQERGVIVCVYKMDAFILLISLKKRALHVCVCMVPHHLMMTSTLSKNGKSCMCVHGAPSFLNDQHVSFKLVCV